MPWGQLRGAWRVRVVNASAENATIHRSRITIHAFRPPRPRPTGVVEGEPREVLEFLWQVFVAGHRALAVEIAHLRARAAQTRVREQREVFARLWLRRPRRRKFPRRPRREVAPQRDIGFSNRERTELDEVVTASARAELRPRRRRRGIVEVGNGRAALSRSRFVTGETLQSSSITSCSRRCWNEQPIPKRVSLSMRFARRPRWPASVFAGSPARGVKAGRSIARASGARSSSAKNAGGLATMLKISASSNAPSGPAR